jgi:hypothetical protein
MRALACLVLLAALVAGCGASSGAESVDLENAATKTGAASARIEMDMALDADATKLSAKDREEMALLTFKASGEIAEHGRLYRLRYVYPRKAFGLEGKGDVTFEALLDSESGDIYVAYGPELDIPLPAGKRWVHMQDDSLQGFGNANDPAMMVSYLKAAGDLDRVGEAEVRGVATTRYSGTIDLDRAKEELGAENEGVEEGFDQLKEAGVEELPVEVWIDGEDYVRRLEMDWVFPESIGAPKGTRMTLSLEMWDFGAAFDLALPPKSTVVEQEELEG